MSTRTGLTEARAGQLVAEYRVSEPHGWPAYSVFVSQASEVSPLTYGTDLYVVYEPDARRAHPAAQGTLLWVRVVHRAPSGGRAVSYVDNIGGVHPFTATGGRTSILGEQVVNLDYVDGIERFPGRPDDPGVTPERFMAETFLARDTGIRDPAGKTIVTILGGLEWGWRLTEIGPQPASTRSSFRRTGAIGEPSTR